MINKIIKDPKVDSPYGKTNWKDWLVSLKNTIVSKAGFAWISINTIFEAFFGPEFFSQVADFCSQIGVSLPKNSATSIGLALLVWGIGSACIYFSKLKARKYNGE